MAAAQALPNYVQLCTVHSLAALEIPGSRACFSFEESKSKNIVQLCTTMHPLSDWASA